MPDTSVTRVLIVDDEPPARAVLREMLGRIPGVAVVGEAGDGLEALKAAGELAPDAVFLDIQMPRLDGFEPVARLAHDRDARNSPEHLSQDRPGRRLVVDDQDPSHGVCGHRERS